MNCVGHHGKKLPVAIRLRGSHRILESESSPERSSTIALCNENRQAGATTCPLRDRTRPRKGPQWDQPLEKKRLTRSRRHYVWIRTAWDAVGNLFDRLANQE